MESKTLKFLKQIRPGCRIRKIGETGDGKLVAGARLDLEALGPVVEFVDGTSKLLGLMKFNYEIICSQK